MFVNEEAMSWRQRFGGNEDFYSLWTFCVDDVKLHDHVKLRLPSGETFWVEVCLRSSNYWIGILKSKVETVAMQVGDLVRFHRCNTFGISKYQEEATL